MPEVRRSRKLYRKLLYYGIRLFYLSAGKLKFRNEIKIAEPGVVAFWHDEMLPIVYYFRHTSALILAGRNHFGSAMSELFEYWNYRVFQGSPRPKVKLDFKRVANSDRRSDKNDTEIKIMEKVIAELMNRGGKRAIEKIIEEIINSNRNLLIAVDGSRGPRHQMKAGALIVAQKAQVPLYLLRASYNGIPFIFSWDRHRIPYPFAEVKLHISDTIRIDKDADKHQINQKISACEHLLANLVNQ